MSSAALKIGIAGLGNVGASVLALLQEHAALLEDRCGKPLRVTAVSARDKSKDRGLDMKGIRWHENAAGLAADPDVDVVVELIGGAEGAAFDLIKKSLELGKPVVTANKALLALRCPEVLSLLAESGSSVSFEAAVAGGIPVIKGLREGLAANNVQAVYGILNGTCNFILSEMQETGRAFEDVLKEAQDLGYAEADPAFDIDGHDAAHKLAILAGLSFGGAPDVKAISVQGIRHVTELDIAFAEELGYRIKLLGIARQTEKGVEQSVEPCLVPKDSALAAINGALNAVYIDSDFAGKTLFTGAGAGGKATASAVVADILDVARGRALPLMGVDARKAGSLKIAPMGERIGSYYLRLMVLDQPGVFADVSAILRDCEVSLECVLQRGHAPGQRVPVILSSHEAPDRGMREAVRKISALKSIVEPPHLMRIEEFK